MNKKKMIMMIIIVLILLVLDQTLKIYVINHKGSEMQTILPGINLTYEESNKGAFGVGQSGVITYVISTVVVLGVVLKFFLNQIERIHIGMVVGISLVFAGGLSNLLDKIFHGFVVNYVQFLELPAVNLSFLFIVLGWIALAAMFAFYTWKEMRKDNA